jgi:DNA-binding LacI/PurR family transcriptional regulator
MVVIEAAAPAASDAVALRRLVADFRPAAVVVHDDRSCKVIRKIDPGLPILFLQGASRSGPNWDACYIVDDQRVGELAAEALLAAGRRRAAIFFPMPGSSRCATERMDGFRSVWEPSGGSSELIQLSSLAPVYVEAVAAGLGDVWRGSERLDAARVVEARFVGTRFDAAYFFSDAAALAGMRALLTVGVRVPADVAVIGTDNLFWGAFSVPSLTTMELNERLFAQRIADDLEASFRGTPWSGAVVRLPVSLIKRESA